MILEIKNKYFFIVLFLSIFIGSTTPIDKQPIELLFKVAVNKKVFKEGEPILLSYKIKNISKKKIIIQNPSIIEKTILIDTYRNGKRVVGHIIWEYPPASQFNLNINEDTSFTINLLEKYPLLLDPGNYKLKSIYYPLPNTKIESNTLNIVIENLSSEENKIKNAYLRILHGISMPGVERIGEAFLFQYPSSIFSNRVRLQIANHYISTGSYQKGIDILSGISKNKLTIQEELEENYFLVGSAYLKLGKLDQAKNIVEKMEKPDQRLLKYVTHLKRKNELLKKE